MRALVLLAFLWCSPMALGHLVKGLPDGRTPKGQADFNSKSLGATLSRSRSLENNETNITKNHRSPKSLPSDNTRIFLKPIYKPIGPVNPVVQATLLPEDEVALAVHNAVRIIRGVPPIAFDPNLKALAQECANWHADSTSELLLDDPQMDPFEFDCPFIGLRLVNGIELQQRELIPTVRAPAENIFRMLTTWYTNPDPAGGLEELDYPNPMYTPILRKKVQMIWRSSTAFACARSVRNSPPDGGGIRYMYTSCIYSPPGNTGDFQANVPAPSL